MTLSLTRSAVVTEFITATYENESPPGNSLRFLLWFDNGTDGDVLIDGKDALSDSPSVSFTLAQEGSYRVSCQRLTINSTVIGPVAWSYTIYVGRGEYLAPLTIVFGAA